MNNESLENDRSALNALFLNCESPELDNPYEVMETPCLPINLEEVNDESKAKANDIVERLSGYYFDQKYIDEHPYIPNKISQEIDNIRRLIKMININEIAQDSLISNITINPGKSALYSSLTSLQQSTLNIQRQLDDSVTSIEDIFRKMQDECKITFAEKSKEENSDGSLTVRGSKDFIKELTKKLYSKDPIVDEETGEVISQ